MVRYDALNPQWTRVLAPVALADRRVALPYAERLARQGDSLFRRQLADVFTSMNPRERAQQLAFALGEQRDALGWVYFNEGHVAEAERALTRARRARPREADGLLPPRPRGRGSRPVGQRAGALR